MHEPASKAWPAYTEDDLDGPEDPQSYSHSRGQKGASVNGDEPRPPSPAGLRHLPPGPSSDFVRHISRRRRDSHASLSSTHSAWRGTTSARLSRIWTRHRSVLLMLGAQFFGVVMNLCARILEHDDEPMHPFQLLFARMVITLLFANAYMYFAKTPDFPLGSPGIRWLLLARGVTGFVGIYGMWESIRYLPLAEATVITFLVPCVSGYMCHLMIHEPFARREQMASFVALAGVVLIARPGALLGLDGGNSAGEDLSLPPMMGNSTTVVGQDEDDVTPAQRLGAIALSLVGVVGTSAAFMAIRRIGPRAHPLVSTNYFSLVCTAVTTVSLAVAPALDVRQPGMRFALPRGGRQWGLLSVVCACGFLTQFMLTASLGDGARSNRATAMVYTGMLFASAFDKWVFGIEMGALSVVGCGLIIGSAMWAALSKKEAVSETTVSGDLEAAAATSEMGSEEAFLLADEEGDESDGEDGEDGGRFEGRLVEEI